jgi:hypothetical protein
MTDRRTPSLLIPDNVTDPPTAVAEANTALAHALAQRTTATKTAREATAAARQAKHDDLPPSERRKLSEAAEDAEFGEREAKRQVARAESALVAAIAENRTALLEQLPIVETHEQVRQLLAELGTALDRLAADVGTVWAITSIESERTRSRGFEPARSQAARSDRPEAHLAALAAWADRLRAAAESNTADETVAA